MAALAPPRQISIIKPTAASRQAGVLHASPTANTNRTLNPPPHKGRDVRLKVVVRRLAPGLTEEEFRQALGEEWRAGGKKVDWSLYEQGKASKDFAKPSRPSRAYFHLTNVQFLGSLAEKVRTTQFIDAKGTSNDVVLLGPPTLVTTSFNKIPPKARPDGRQGTIDQDPEFIDFLASLTVPVAKPANIDSATDKEKSSDAKVVTPLVQFIKDKKANKGKDARVAKHGRHESKENPAKPDEKKSVAKNAKGKGSNTDQTSTVQPKIEKIKQKPSAKTAKQPQTNATPNPPASATPVAPVAQNAAQTSTTPQAKPERRRERGNASIAAQILQRDLGLVNGGQGRRKREATNPTTDGSAQTTAPPVAQSGSSSSDSAAVAQTMPSTTPTAPSQAPSGPNTNRKAQPNNTPAQQRRPTPTKPSSATLSTATQAFLKHANPSQGVTEPLLEEAFKIFGRVTKVEIDKKKGFAYVDFAEPDGLQKAIASSPVQVGQGQVVVLERKSGPVLQNRNARGGQDAANPAGPVNRGGRGGSRGRGGKSHASQSKPTNIVSTANAAPVAVTAPS